ncbi:MAG TPA: carboxylating nicotinate-nucleotide diphosphorylase, partial [Vicinamibacterales bacterium]|nr:carboxylating nicotinate-nucleotide diphosphorylase [Vicinamibacterales bacterium]
MSIAPPDPELYRDLVRRALAEDVGAGDLTTEATIGPRQRAHGVLLARVPCVLAGLPVAIETFRQVSRAVEIQARRADGDPCGRGDVVAEVSGPARALLTAERTALNFLQRLSGIATLTRRFVEAAGGRVTVLDTRKTTPTLRALEKYAVRCGGGANHRMGLDDGILIKENHARLAGGIVEAVRRVRAAGHRPIEVEAQSLEEVDAALAAGAEIVLLDNLPLEELREAVERIRGRARIEVSGGVTLERLPEIAALGVDCVSVGALTHSAPAVDLSFEV